MFAISDSNFFNRETEKCFYLNTVLEKLNKSIQFVFIHHCVRSHFPMRLLYNLSCIQ